MTTRTYTTRRKMIVTSLVTKLKTINGLGAFLTDLGNQVEPRLKFWDEIDDFPAIHCNAGTETREYLGAGVKIRFLNITLRCYVKAEDSTDALDRLIEDVETVIEGNSRLSYVDNQGATQFTQDIKILSIETDEGVLEPLGVGEVLLEVRY